MTDEIKKINVRIGGVSYQLVSAEDDQYTRQIANRADELIRRVMQSNSHLTQNMSSILALVNVLDEVYRVRQQLGTMDDKRQAYDNQLSEVRGELTRLREQTWDMKKEILRLTALCRDYEALLGESAKGKKPVARSGSSLAKDFDFADDSAYVEEPAQTTPENDDKSKKMTQANLEDYMRENGWPQP